jgi:hypothetical protein
MGEERYDGHRMVDAWITLMGVGECPIRNGRWRPRHMPVMSGPGLRTLASWAARKLSRRCHNSRDISRAPPAHPEMVCAGETALRRRGEIP